MKAMAAKLSLMMCVFMGVVSSAADVYIKRQNCCLSQVMVLTLNRYFGPVQPQCAGRLRRAIEPESTAMKRLVPDPKSELVRLSVYFLNRASGRW
jgi:hypothetical protein